MNITDQINDFLNKEIKTLHIAVIGDVMLDKYLYGSVDRISPEAPVPIVKIEKEKTVLGGAANVAANLISLGCKVDIIGVIGNDFNRNVVESILNQQKICHDGLVVSDKRATITKVRVLGGQQQMLRMDFEEVNDLFKNESVFLKKKLRNFLLTV